MEQENNTIQWDVERQIEWSEMTPNRALNILNNHIYERQRPVKKTQIRNLVNIMKSGHWVENHPITFCRIGKQYKLVNGQHRLRAVVESGQTHHFSIVILKAGNEDELHQIYCSFDVNNSKRSNADLLKSADFYEKFDINKGVGDKSISAAVLAETNLKRLHYTQEGSVRDTAAKLAIAHKWVEQIRQYQNAVELADKQLKGKMLCDGVFSVALQTYKWQPELAHKFWIELAKDDGLSRNDPRKVLAIALRNRSFSVKAKIQPERLTVTAWNAFFNKKNLPSGIKVNTDKPLRFLGTPIVLE